MLYMSIIRGYASDEYKDVKCRGCGAAVLILAFAAAVTRLGMVRKGASSTFFGALEQKRRGWRAFPHHDDVGRHRRFAKMRPGGDAEV